MALIACGPCKGEGRVRKGKDLCGTCGGLGLIREPEFGMIAFPDLTELKRKADAALIALARTRPR